MSIDPSLTRITVEAPGVSDGSIITFFCISLTIFSVSSLLVNASRLDVYLMGLVSRVSTLCLTMLVLPFSPSPKSKASEFCKKLRIFFCVHDFVRIDAYCSYSTPGRPFHILYVLLVISKYHDDFGSYHNFRDFIEVGFSYQ